MYSKAYLLYAAAFAFAPSLLVQGAPTPDGSYLSIEARDIPKVAGPLTLLSRDSPAADVGAASKSLADAIKAEVKAIMAAAGVQAGKGAKKMATGAQGDKGAKKEAAVAGMGTEATGGNGGDGGAGAMGQTGEDEKNNTAAVVNRRFHGLGERGHADIGGLKTLVPRNATAGDELGAAIHGMVDAIVKESMAATNTAGAAAGKKAAKVAGDKSNGNGNVGADNGTGSGGKGNGNGNNGVGNGQRNGNGNGGN